MQQAIIKINFDNDKLQKMGLELENEIKGWLESDETGIYVESIEKI